MEFNILTKKDKNAIKDLFRYVFMQAPWNDDWSDDTQLDAYIEDLIGNQNSLTFGITDENDLIAVSMGYTFHWCDGPEYHVEEFCVSG